MQLSKNANCALRIRISHLTLLCCLLGVAQVCELNVSGHSDWKVAGGVGCNGKHSAQIMSSTCPVYLEPQDQTLQRRSRVHDMSDSICNGRRNVFCIECYTRKYVHIRSSCHAQPLQQRDAQEFINTVGGKYYAQIIAIPFVSPFQCWVRSDTPSSTCKFIIPPALKPKTNIETGMQGVCNTNSMQNSFRLPYIYIYIYIYIYTHIYIYIYIHIYIYIYILMIMMIIIMIIKHINISRP